MTYRIWQDKRGEYFVILSTNSISSFVRGFRTESEAQAWIEKDAVHSAVGL